MQSKIRTFICIDFPNKIIKEIARVQEIIGKKQFTGKLTELENLHLTLKFLGEINEEKLDKVKDKLSKIKHSKINLKLSHIGFFSYKNNPRIIWIKVIGKIFTLQKQIDETLSNLFPKEKRFMSHLTMARIKHVKDKTNFQEYIKNMKIKQLSFPCNSFKLKSSELKPQGPIYTTIKSYHLKD